MDKTEWTLEIVAQPKGQPRPKFCRRGAFVHAYTPATADDFKQACRAAARSAGLSHKRLEGPIGLTVIFMMPRPASHFGSGKNSETLKPAAPRGWHTQKPDLDNIEKALKDALSDEGVWVDDCQVCKCSKTKTWSDTPGFPGSTSLMIKLL